MLALGLVVVIGCSERALPVSEARVVTIDEGPLRGARLNVPYGAYTGIEALTLATGADIPLDDMGEPGDAVAAVGPAVEFGPDGTQFAEAVTISLPFSSQIYNAGAMEGSEIAIVAKHTDGAEIKIDVGPVFMETIVAPNKPIEIDVGPVFLVANEGNEENDVLIVFQTTHFSSYQVVRVERCGCEDDEAACNGEGDCVACANWTQVSAGLAHTCGLFDKAGPSKMVCWGYNGNNQLGHKGGDGSTKYIEIELDWSAVAGGETHTCGIANKGKLYCWGSDDYGQLGIVGPELDTGTPSAAGNPDMRWKSVSVGMTHSCAIDQNDKMWCWGGNEHGQLGFGDVGGLQDTPKEVVGNHTWTQVSAGSNHTCGLRADHSLWCWGANNLDQLGVPLEKTKEGTPQQVTNEAGDRWMVLATGQQHSCAITNGDCDDGEECAEEGTLYCWGSNGDGRLGIGTIEQKRTITAVVTNNSWTEVAAGGGHTCALGRGPDGNGLFCWGSNASSQLKRSPGDIPTRNTPLLVDEKHNWSHLTSGSDHNCAILTDGQAHTLWCWGDNNSGKLGSSQLESGVSAEPVQVSCPDESGEAVDPCVPLCLPNTCVDDGCGGTCPCSDGFGCELGECTVTVGIGTGACLGSDDATALKNGSYLGFLHDCMSENNGCPIEAGAPDIECLKDCLMDEPLDLSGGCSGCFEKLVDCATSECTDVCLDAPSVWEWDCYKSCLYQPGCLADLNECTGLCGDDICQVATENQISCPNDCTVCSPSCDGTICGDDGCGGTCSCTAGFSCVAEVCECAPNCTNKNCGDDGCDGLCGECSMGYTCETTGQCVANCVPACNGKLCGDDGCDGDCGTCPAGQSCAGDGQCNKAYCLPDCTDNECGDDGCGSKCGQCNDNNSCTTNFCKGKKCKYDDIPGCGFSGGGGFYEVSAVGCDATKKTAVETGIEPAMNFSMVTWKTLGDSTVFTIHLLASWDDTPLPGVRHFSVLIDAPASSGGTGIVGTGSTEAWPYKDATHWVSWTNETEAGPISSNFSCQPKTWSSSASAWQFASFPGVGAVTCLAYPGTSGVEIAVPSDPFAPANSSFRVVVDYDDPSTGGILQKTLSESGTAIGGDFIPFQ
jgi:alpha-tubulin suppressor-like RCC1 family protein